MLPELAIRGSVGTGGKNARTDVRVVQLLLNTWLRRAGQPLLAIDGIAGPLTCKAISSCQEALGLPVVDGRVDPHGPTLKTLGMLFLEDLSKGLRRSAFQAYGFAPGSTPLPAPDLLKVLWMVLAGSHHMSG
jgi:peptidoglycan hydrolase-like protein with peptidoglycan-binding domain